MFKKYVKSVNSRGITYTDEFKTVFIAERSMGKLPVQIFRDAGFYISILGNDRIWLSSKRWCNAYKQFDDLGFRDSSKFNSGRPLKHELTLEEIRMQKLLIGKLRQNY